MLLSKAGKNANSQGSELDFSLLVRLNKNHNKEKEIVLGMRLQVHSSLVG